MDASDLHKIVDWLIDGARSASSPTQMMAETCERLVQAGFPLWRVGVFLRTLHPDIFGRSFVWRPGAEVVVNTVDFDVRDSPQFKNSPAGDPVRWGTRGQVSPRRSREQALCIFRRHARGGRHGLYRTAASLYRRFDSRIELDHEAAGRIHR